MPCSHMFLSFTPLYFSPIFLHEIFTFMTACNPPSLFFLLFSFSLLRYMCANSATCKRTLQVPFPDARLASVALQALRVDKELSGLVKRELSTVASPGSEHDGETVLQVDYKATTNRMLRVAVNSFMDSLALVLEVQEEMDVDIIESEKANN